jgi:hypothetical protein
MVNWYYRVTSDLSTIPDFIDYYESELTDARKELSLKGQSIEKHAAELPGIVEQRFTQLQTIESVLEYLIYSSVKNGLPSLKKFLEAYNRALSSRDAEKYVDGVQSIVDMSMLINEVALLRNKYLGITKALETKNFMISNITKLKCAGIEDSRIN